MSRRGSSGKPAVDAPQRLVGVLRTLDGDPEPGEAGAASPGVEGNRRMTAMLAAVLLVLLAVEGGTIPFLGSLEPVHVIVGFVLLPVVVLKMATTFYRFAGYYAGRAAYRAAGPPHPLMRGLGPVVVVLTVLLFASGVVLAATGRHPAVYTIHKLSFIAWFVAMTVHVLGHLWSVAVVAPRDWTARTRAQGWRQRVLVVAGATAAGCLLAALVYPLLPAWGHG